MTIAKTIYHSAGKPSDETLTANIQRHEQSHGNLVALTSYTIPKEETKHKLGEDHVIIGVFRRE